MGLVAPFEELENKFSEYIGADGAVSVVNGTAALHLAFAGKNYKEGSEVIVPEFSMIATAWGPYYAGLVPVPVDCDDTMNIDPSKIEVKINKNTVAILITHVYGRVCNIQAIVDLCDKYGLDLFEDCCEAHGAEYKDGPKAGKKVGSLGISCFSFYKNKIVNAEEGGMITVPHSKTGPWAGSNHSYIDNLRDLKNMSFGSKHNYVHSTIGFNYRMPDSQATLALNSLNLIEENLKKRKDIERWYNNELSDLNFGFMVRPERDVVWVYDINCHDPASAVDHLNRKGTAARRTFFPTSRQPCWGYRWRHLWPDIGIGGDGETSLNFYNSTCYLPVEDSMSEEDVINICKELRFWYNRAII